MSMLPPLLAASLWAAPVIPSSTTIATPQDLVGAAVEPSADFKELTAFPETLVYDVSWGPLGVGQATLEVQEFVEFNGRPAYHLISRAVSNKFCDGFYKVRDYNESWLDAKTHQSLGYSKKLREGGFFRDEWVVYQPEQGSWFGRITNRDGSFTVKIGTMPAVVHDVLSAMWYVRNQELVPGKDIVVDVNTRQNWPLVIRVLRKEKTKTPAGRFEAFVVEPALRQEGIFIQKGKKLQIWLSDDPKRVPVLMKVEVFFGHITAKLVKMVYSTR